MILLQDFIGGRDTFQPIFSRRDFSPLIENWTYTLHLQLEALKRVVFVTKPTQAESLHQ